MWGWLFVFLAFVLLFYVFFLKREIRKLKVELEEIPERASFGGRLSLDFRDPSLLDLVDELNQMIDVFEGKNRYAKQMEENVKLSIAGVSHDLRTPLTSVKGYVQLLYETDDETKRRHYLKMIDQSVTRLVEMTNQFYDLARIDTDQKEMELSSLPFSNIVEEVFLSFYEQLEEQEIELKFPKQKYDVRIIADELMLTRVIQNIVQNIIRYAKSKAIISFKSEKNDAVFTMKNDIKPDNKLAVEKVFMRFYTEITSRTNSEASGLGLYLSKKLIEKMDGKMDAELNGNWFILTIRLPLNRSRT